MRINLIFAAAMLAAPFMSFSAAACCSYGCCDCSCVAKTPIEAKSRADKIAGDFNNALHKKKVSGYVSEFHIVTVKPESGTKEAASIPNGCSYTCDANDNELICKVQCK